MLAALYFVAGRSSGRMPRLLSAAAAVTPGRKPPNVASAAKTGATADKPAASDATDE